MLYATIDIIIGILAYILCGSSYAVDINFLVPKPSAETQKMAVEALISRTIGEADSKHFIVAIDEGMASRSFKFSKIASSTISIQASDGISAAKGFHYYLKYYLDRDIDWAHSRIELPTPLILPNVTVFSKSASNFIYYQNVCTWSYSFSWWTFATWRHHIDWMAMMGITLTIAPVQEEIWHSIYEDIGLTETEIENHFAGPAFQTWQRMGNMHGWGGPSSTTYQRMQTLLQQQIIKAQRQFGMRVALPAFAGYVPSAMPRLYPNTTFTPTSRWNSFPDTYCCNLFLDPNETLFQTVASKFLQRTIQTYGSDSIYFCDPFNENEPRLQDAFYMNATAFFIYESMRRIDEKATWLLQGWMFVKNIFWTDNLIKAFLTAVPQGSMLVLDLQSEQFPQYERTYSFYGQPFIWCMLHNFGGTLGMHGSVDIVNSRIRVARKMQNSTMVGVGITSEGINQNYVVYALALERAWLSDDINLVGWFNHFVDVRYGVRDPRLRHAWQLLRKSVYSFKGLQKIRGKYTICRRPATNLNPWIWYDESLIYEAWQYLLMAANSSFSVQSLKSYEHDLVDLTRQFLQVTADRLYINILAAFRTRQKDKLHFLVNKFASVFDDLNSILASNENFLLGRWIKDAKKLGSSPLEKQLFEMNARNQITGWGPNGQIIDYATKQWAGIVADYYRPRWLFFLKSLEQSLENKEPFNELKFKQTIKEEIENPFSVSTKSYSTRSTGNTLNLARHIFEKWTMYLNDSYFLQHFKLKITRIK